MAGVMVRGVSLMAGEPFSVSWRYVPTVQRLRLRLWHRTSPDVYVAIDHLDPIENGPRREVFDERLGALLPGALLPATPGTVQVSTLALRAAFRRHLPVRVRYYPMKVGALDLIVNDVYAVHDWARDVHGLNR